MLQALDETDAAVVGGVWQISPGAPGPVAAAIARAVAHPMGAGDAAYRLSARREHERRRVDTVPFGGFRRSHWREIGGYNEQLLVNEDYEFNYRTRQAGGSVVLDTAIRCEYFARPSLAALARQYFRYGWWKGRMLRQHPRSIRIRQAVPALFLPAWLLLAVAAALAPVARPVRRRAGGRIRRRAHRGGRSTPPPASGASSSRSLRRSSRSTRRGAPASPRSS